MMTQSFDKVLIPTENSTTNWQHKVATKHFDYTTIAGRLKTVSWSNNNKPTGVVKPVYEYPTFPLQQIRNTVWCSKLSLENMVTHGKTDMNNMSILHLVFIWRDPGTGRCSQCQYLTNGNGW